MRILVCHARAHEDIGHDGDDAFGDNAINNVEAAVQKLPKRIKFV